MKMRSGYHLFSIEWNQKEIVWKIDEIIYKAESLDKHFNRSETEENFPENGKPFDNDFKFYIQNVGLNSSEFNISEAYVLIDYMKVYEWKTNLDNNCGLPALPPQVFIKEYRDLMPLKKYENGKKVEFDCSGSSNGTHILIGNKTSVCTKGKWSNKTGVCGN
jgi:hypothetical protein